MTSSIATSDNAAQFPPAEIRMVGLAKWFGATQVLRDINLEVRAAERLVICGPSGSGKSTLIRCINGLEPYQRGELDVRGVRVREDAASLDAVRREVGMVFQQFNLFGHLTVLENLMLAPVWVGGQSRAQARELAQHWLARVHIADQQHKYPAQLSGGQQQRVAIARALCMRPKIMLFDEPTSALDPEMVQEVLDVMTELAQNNDMTMLCVTHEMGFARRVADRVVFMEAGSIMEDTPAQAFFEAPRTERARTFLSDIAH